MIGVRPWEPTRDREVLRALIVELQEYERTLEPQLPAGDTIADAYLAWVLERCRTHAGTVLLAEVDATVAGYGTVMTAGVGDAPDDPAEHAYITDLLVLPRYRGQGVGRTLLAAIETHARGCGALRLRVGVLARNHGARRLYQAVGFREYHVQLQKEL